MKKLNFEFITVDANRVVVMFGGGFYHYGFEMTHGERQWGLWEVKPGLWYWNEAGKRPTSLADAPRLRKSTKMFIVGALSLVAAILLILRSKSVARRHIQSIALT